MLQILSLYFEFEGAKNIHVHEFLILGFGGHLKFLMRVRYRNLYLDMVTGLWYTHVLNFGSLSWFWRCKKRPCLLVTHFWIWGMLDDPDWGFASWSWFGYGHWSLIHPCSKSSFGVLEDAGGSWLEFGILVLIWIWSLVFDKPMIQVLALYLGFEGEKKIHVLWVLVWGFGGAWSFLTGV